MLLRIASAIKKSPQVAGRSAWRGYPSRMAGYSSSPEPPDPHKWLEEVLGEKQLDWVKEQNAKCMGWVEKWLNEHNLGGWDDDGSSNWVDAKARAGGKRKWFER